VLRSLTGCIVSFLSSIRQDTYVSEASMLLLRTHLQELLPPGHVVFRKPLVLLVNRDGDFPVTILL